MDHFSWKMSFLTKLLGKDGHTHHFSTYKKWITNIGDTKKKMNTNRHLSYY